MNHYRWYLDALINWLIVVFVIWGAMKIDNLLVYYLVLFPLGMIQLHLGLLSHDAIHGQVTKNKNTNVMISNLVRFWPMFNFLESYRRHPMPDHKYVGTVKDPELIDVLKNNSPRSDLPITKKKLISLLVRDALFINLAETINTMGFLSPETVTDWIGMVSFWLVLTVLSYHYNCWTP